jgi:trimeric autotransporter adhesin
VKARGLVYLGVMVLCVSTSVAWGQNTFYGTGAGNGSMTGTQETFIGYWAGHANTSGNYNTFLGYGTGTVNTSGNDNTFVGRAAGGSNTTGSSNTFVGRAAGEFNTFGEENTFLGFQTGFANSTGSWNTFLGQAAGQANSTGNDNTFVGYSAGSANTTGYENTFIGESAGSGNTTGRNNTSIGFQSGFYNSTGHGNVFLGDRAGYNETGSDRLYIENSGAITPLIYGEFDNRILSFDGSVGVNVYPLYKFDVSGDGVSKSSMHFSMAGTDVGGWITSVLDNNFFLSSGAMNDSDAGGWIQKSSDGKSVYAGSGGAGYSVYLQSGGTVGTPVSSALRFRIDYTGNVGLGVAAPSYPIHSVTGAFLSAGGVWTDASSREVKENIRDLTLEEAMEALAGLNPVAFNYKADAREKHVGFIAEDVPELVASANRKGLSPMDIVAVLTRAVQEQQKTIAELREDIQRVRSEMRAQTAGPHRTVAMAQDWK